jgi:hypothetical protein
MLLNELEFEVKVSKVKSYLTPDWERLVKSCESPTVEIPEGLLKDKAAFLRG